MFQSIQYLSLDKMKALSPSRDTVVISILDRYEAPRRPALAGWHDSLVMSFEDTFEENKYSSAMWPDEPTDDEHARYCQGKGERVPALSDARAMADFMLHHGRTSVPLHLLVHCYQGVSRSAAVAQWASARFFVGLTREPTYPNLRVLRLLDKAAPK